MKNEIPFTTRVVSCFVFKTIAGETKTLIMKRVGEPLDGEWCQVAGKLEAGETGWQAALRELQEEAALTPDQFFNAGLCEQYYSHEVDAIAIFPVFVAFVGEDAQVVINEEHSEFKWMTMGQAQSVLPYPRQRRLLAQVWEDFIDNEPTALLRVCL